MTTKMAAPDRPMTERKMEPWMLRDLAQITRDHTWGKDTDWTRHIDAEAARREAEAAKPKQGPQAAGPKPELEDIAAAPIVGQLFELSMDFGDGQFKQWKAVGFTLADVHEFVRSERLTRERYNELRAKLLDGGAK